MKNRIFICIACLFVLQACQQKVPADKIINQKASLPEVFGIGKMQVIASSINKRKHTMSTLYGNPVSVNRARSRAPVSKGEKLILVTWQQQADDNWFGANIPAGIQSVEQVTTEGDATNVKYQQYTGKKLALNSDTIGQNWRKNTILEMQASKMP